MTTRQEEQDTEAWVDGRQAFLDEFGKTINKLDIAQKALIRLMLNPPRFQAETALAARRAVDAIRALDNKDDKEATDEVLDRDPS